MTDELEDRPAADKDVKVPPEGSELPSRDEKDPPEDPEAETEAGVQP